MPWARDYVCLVRDGEIVQCVTPPSRARGGMISVVCWYARGREIETGVSQLNNEQTRLCAMHKQGMVVAAPVPQYSLLC